MIAETEHLQRPELVEQDSPCVIAPWEENPYQLVSWWKMQEFSAATFYHIATNLCQFQVAVERERTADDAFEKELFFYRLRCARSRKLFCGKQADCVRVSSYARFRIGIDRLR